MGQIPRHIDPVHPERYPPFNHRLQILRWPGGGLKFKGHV